MGARAVPRLSRAAFAGALLAGTIAAAPADSEAATQRLVSASPQQALTATVTVDRRQVALTASRRGVVVLRAELGRLPAALRGSRPLAARASTTRVLQRFSTPAGKRRDHTLFATRTTLRLPGGARLELLLADEGLAFRQVRFSRRTVTYRPPAGSRGWLQRLTRHYEGDYVPTPLTAARGSVAYPALLSAPDGTYTLLHEAGLRYGQAAEHLIASIGRPGALRTVSPDPALDAEPASAWRVAVIGTLADVVESELPVALARPSRIADPSWIRPGRAAWSWWADRTSPGSLEAQRRHVDFAARAGFEYVLVDEGWDPAWVPGLVAHAAARGVRVLLWTDWLALADPAVRAATLDQWAAWGVAGIKADFLLSDEGARMAAMDDIAADAAARRLLVTFHGSTVPRGIQRTWPNVLTLEGVRGAEHARGATPIAPAATVTLAFTRNAVGPMDYTPVAFSAPGRLSSAAAELAQAVVFESGLQHYPDSPEAYEARPQALELLRQVPAAWDDTRLLDGAPGVAVTLARRHGDAWFVGSLSATAAREQLVSLGFLDGGRAYRARIHADDGADGLAVTERLVSAADTLAIPLAANGGFTVTLFPG